MKPTSKRKGKSIMSEQTTPVVVVEEIEVKRRGFNLDTFERESLEGKITFTPLPEEGYLEESLKRVDGDQERLRDLLQASMRRLAIQEKKNALQPNPETQKNWIPSAKAVLAFVNNFRGIAPYSAEKDRKKQTGMIVAFLRSNPALMEALKTLALAAKDAGEDEDETDE